MRKVTATLAATAVVAGALIAVVQAHASPVRVCRQRKEVVVRQADGTYAVTRDFNGLKAGIWALEDGRQLAAWRLSDWRDAWDFTNITIAQSTDPPGAARVVRFRGERWPYYAGKGFFINRLDITVQKCTRRR